MLDPIMCPYPPHVPVRGPDPHGSGQLGGRIKLVQNQLAGEVRSSEVLDSSSYMDDRDVFGYRKKKVATVVSGKKNSLLL